MKTEIIMEHTGIDKLEHCPECGVSWDGGSIFETLRNQEWCAHMSDEELQKDIEEKYSPPYRWGRLIGVELAYDHPNHYDGVSYWKCPDCETVWDRFTGKKVAKE